MSDPGFVEHCLELLAPLGSTHARRMFSGHGLYVDDLCVALILRDTLYLKTAEAHRPAFEAAGSHPFTYSGKHGDVHVTSYWSAPEAAMESPPEMRPWARRALEAAVAARAKKAPRKSAGRSAAGRSAAKKVAAKKIATHEVAAKKVAARKVAAKKVGAKKTAATKAPAKKAPASPGGRKSGP